ncbi:MAG: putative head morphosis protein [Phenylobacterium sp.]|nr:putative head morphosis protein [Phenylobacterium sp.]
MTALYLPRGLAFDKGPSPRSAFIRTRKAEVQYGRQLRKLAKHIGDLIDGMWVPDDLSAADQIAEAMQRYSRTIEPWARSVASRMLADVAARDRKAWKAVSAEMGRLLHEEIANAPTGQLMQQRLADQVSLITSLPPEAAARVHTLTLEGITLGRRAADIATEIGRSGEVSASRAMTIARTEVGRTATELTAVRAQAVGSTMFVWRTAGDADVRASHRALNGRAFRWDDPPECDPGHHALPGAIWNCRCIPEPILPDA